MKTKEPRATHLKDYRPAPYRIPEVELDFHLDGQATRVTSIMQVERIAAGPEPLQLDGQRLKLISVKLDGKPLDPTAYAVDASSLTVFSPPQSFTLELVTEIAPAENTALEGLYMAGGIFCTQCEPEGFRCITYFIDRPDNLARFQTRIEAHFAVAPVLLSNGNLMESGELDDGRHFAIWRDPFPKPSYLFALVAGDLGHIADHFDHDVRPACRSAHLCRTRQRAARPLRHGCAQALHALGRRSLRARIRSRHLHDRGRLGIQFRRDGEQGPQHFQRQGAAGEPRNRDG